MLSKLTLPFLCLGRFQSAGTELISPTGEQMSAPSMSDIITPKEKTPLCKGSAEYKPFADDPEKEARYEKYLEAQRSGNTGKPLQHFEMCSINYAVT